MAVLFLPNSANHEHVPMLARLSHLRSGAIDDAVDRVIDVLNYIFVRGRDKTKNVTFGSLVSMNIRVAVQWCAL